MGSVDDSPNNNITPPAVNQVKSSLFCNNRVQYYTNHVEITCQPELIPFRYFCSQQSQEYFMKTTFSAIVLAALPLVGFAQNYAPMPPQPAPQQYQQPAAPQYQTAPAPQYQAAPQQLSDPGYYGQVDLATNAPPPAVELIIEINPPTTGIGPSSTVTVTVSTLEVSAELVRMRRVLPIL